jgi:hypothetical protein
MRTSRPSSNLSPFARRSAKMKMKIRPLLTTSSLAVALVLAGSTAHAQTCQPGISAALSGPHAPTYISLATTLFSPGVYNTLTSQLTAVVDDATYDMLLASANAVAAAAAGRLLITLPDGTVVIDTNRNDGPGDPRNNLYANFLAKTINENHNSRVAIFMAQEYPCGVGVENKFSTSTGMDETYVARRAGDHLDSAGTLRLSIQAP